LVWTGQVAQSNLLPLALAMPKIGMYFGLQSGVTP
jgi:hypothetical protein